MKDALYVRFMPGVGSETRELIPSVVTADYDDWGTLLGIEVMGPGEVRIDGRPACTMGERVVMTHPGITFDD